MKNTIKQVLLRFIHSYNYTIREGEANKKTTHAKTY